jgi:transcriptional regulator with XRE-family HTH domain
MTSLQTGLRARREAAGLSREKLARLADCSTSSITQFENFYVPSQSMAQRIAEALGCDDPAELFDRIGK